jgi:hypothetical protein
MLSRAGIIASLPADWFVHRYLPGVELKAWMPPPYGLERY